MPPDSQKLLEAVLQISRETSTKVDGFRDDLQGVRSEMVNHTLVIKGDFAKLNTTVAVLEERVAGLCKDVKEGTRSFQRSQEDVSRGFAAAKADVQGELEARDSVLEDHEERLQTQEKIVSNVKGRWWGVVSAVGFASGLLGMALGLWKAAHP